MQKAPFYRARENRFGVIFASAASISLKNAKNSPALRQFRIFAARGHTREFLEAVLYSYFYRLRATARHTPLVINYASRWKSRARGNVRQKVLNF
jgi:homogentisate 1,2-dioxygenase